MRPATPGLSVFFPAYNDSGTIASMVIRAVQARRGADARLRSHRRQRRQRRRDRRDRSTSSRAPIRRCASCTTRRTAATAARCRPASDRRRKELIFYTDGDAQYDPGELALLWAQIDDDVDLVNGYKISRSDPLHRIVIGRIYHHIVKLLFGLKVRDVDCDFRLMRRSIFERDRTSRRPAASSAWR